MPVRQPFEHSIAEEFKPAFEQYSDKIIETMQVTELYKRYAETKVARAGHVRPQFANQGN